MKVSNQVFNLSNQFRLRWLFDAGFWRIVRAGVLANNGITSDVHSQHGQLVIGQLSIKNRREIRIKQCKPEQVGWVLGAPVYLLVKR